MRPEFVYIRCPHCTRIYRTPAGLCAEKLQALLPVLRRLSATCPYCAETVKVGDSFIAAPRLRHA